MAKLWAQSCEVGGAPLRVWALFADKPQRWSSNESEIFLALLLLGLKPHYAAKVKSLSRVGLFATQWTVACQAPLSMGFSRQEYWNGLLFSSPGDLPDPGIEPVSLRSSALVGRFFTTSATWEAHGWCLCVFLNISFNKHLLLLKWE